MKLCQSGVLGDAERVTFHFLLNINEEPSVKKTVSKWIIIIKQICQSCNDVSVQKVFVSLWKSSASVPVHIHLM